LIAQETVLTRFLVRRGDTRGHVVAINGRNAYVSEATGNHVHQNNAIIFFTDGNGINYPSAML